MLRSALKVGLWIVATLVVAVVAIAIGDNRLDEDDSAVAKACSGQATSRQLDRTLFTARALSESGADPICTPPSNDDDYDGVMVSHSPGYRPHKSRFGFLGYEARRR
jgi:hypothetical protein